MRLVFMGTPDFAVPALEALLDAGHHIAAVYSQPPRPAGRGKALRPSPVHLRALEAGIEIRTPVSLRDDEAQAQFRVLAPDAAIVAAYGLILPEAVLAIPPLGCLNIHASLLPRWRGAAPVQRAILAGDEKTGVTIMQMERGLDTGPMLARRETMVNCKNAGELTLELAVIGAELLVETLLGLRKIQPIAQPDEGVTYADKIAKEEARLDFAKTAHEVERQIRAFNPFPGAYFEFDGERIKILAGEPVEQTGPPGTVLDDALTIACGEGAVRPQLVQRSGRGAMPPEALLRGFAIPRGATIG